jgi:FPC/CPF motif-containing protein YcgG
VPPSLTKRSPPSEAALEARFRAFIGERDFPCVGAKSALARGGLEILLARDITSAWDDLRICETLLDYAARYRADPRPFRSLAVLFAGPRRITEPQFETALWQRVQSLSDKDGWLGQAYDPRVSDDPENPHFSLSFGGEAFFIVGLHPGASRPARRFETPVLVFNAHDQFERLREEGRYEQLRSKIIERDIAVAGGANPMLGRFGETSEARQYSGRLVGEAWKCPFDPKPRIRR